MDMYKISPSNGTLQKKLVVTHVELHLWLGFLYQ